MQAQHTASTQMMLWLQNNRNEGITEKEEEDKCNSAGAGCSFYMDTTPQS